MSYEDFMKVVESTKDSERVLSLQKLNDLNRAAKKSTSKKKIHKDELIRL
mgnify:CR=1 FL=1